MDAASLNAQDVPMWIEATHWAARVVLFILVGLSIWSVATMIQCRRLLREASGGSSRLFADLQRKIRERDLNGAIAQSGQSLYASVLSEFSTGAKDPARIDRGVKSLLVLKRTQIEAGLTILATLGSNAPFIGLFGTVLGIIQAFGALGAQQSNASSVMVGISEALVATAVGLFVAIPAVIAFNFLSRELRVLLSNCESLRDLYISKMS